MRRIVKRRTWIIILLVCCALLVLVSVTSVPRLLAAWQYITSLDAPSADQRLLRISPREVRLDGAPDDHIIVALEFLQVGVPRACAHEASVDAGFVEFYGPGGMVTVMRPTRIVPLSNSTYLRDESLPPEQRLYHAIRENGAKQVFASYLGQVNIAKAQPRTFLRILANSADEIKCATAIMDVKRRHAFGEFGIEYGTGSDGQEVLARFGENGDSSRAMITIWTPSGSWAVTIVVHGDTSAALNEMVHGIWATSSIDDDNRTNGEFNVERATRSLRELGVVCHDRDVTTRTPAQSR